MEKVGSVATSPSYTKMEWAADELERLSAELAEAKAEIAKYQQLADDLIAWDGTKTKGLISRAKALRGGK
jgi:hypothetical protein